jgi:predicted MFS family arabinose efflux permease
MNTLLYSRLSLMMFLQYAVWGATSGILPHYLGSPLVQGGLAFTPGQIGLVLLVAPGIGALTAPFIAGQIADRYFNTERFLALLLALMAILRWITSWQTSFAAWLVLSVAYSIVFLPTASLTSSLVFAHIKNPERYFTSIRMWGTIGFVLAMWAFPVIYLQTGLSLQWLPPFLVGLQKPNATALLARSLQFAALISLAFSLYCLTLPSTPPQREAVRKLAFTKAFALFKRPSFMILVITATLLTILHYSYFMNVAPFFSFMGMAVKNIQPAISVAQVSEIIFMGLAGLVIKRLGIRLTISLGSLAFTLSFLIFGLYSRAGVELVVASQFLHGLFLASVYGASLIYVDKLAAEDIRHSAQTVFSLTLFGFGPIIAGNVYPVLEHLCTDQGIVDYSLFWYSLAGIGLGATLLFAGAFREES